MQKSAPPKLIIVKNDFYSLGGLTFVYSALGATVSGGSSVSLSTYTGGTNGGHGRW